MGMMLLERIDDLERKLTELQLELVRVRELARQQGRSVAAPVPRVRPVAPPEPDSESRQAVLFLEPEGAGPTEIAPEPQPLTARLGDLLVRRLDLLGPRGFALAGGIVTALGIAFFFVLASNRGWIGPGARVALGACASALVFGSGVWLGARLGQLAAAVAAVGAGLAGGYTTLLAAVALYGYLSTPLALAAACTIATAGVVVALRWSSELIAGLGLLGAALAPAFLAADSDVSAIGTGFAVVMLAATAIVCVGREWDVVLGVCAAVVGAQAAWLLGSVAPPDAAATAVAAALVLVLLGAAIGRQYRRDRDQLDQLAVTLALAAFVASLAGALVLFPEPAAEGVALLALAAVFVGAGVAILVGVRDLGTVIAAAGFALAAVATADLLSGATLAVVWATQSVLFTALGRRLHEPRFQALGLVYLAGALAHTVVVDAPTRQLFDAAATGFVGSISSVLAVLAATVAAAACALGEHRAAAPERGMLAMLDTFFERLGAAREGLRELLGGLAAVAAVYAAALTFVQLSFTAGHVAVTILWSLAGLAFTFLGGWRGRPPVVFAGLAWLVLVVCKSVGFDWAELPVRSAALGAIVCAAAVLLAGFVVRAQSATPARLGIVSGIAAVYALCAGALSIPSLLYPSASELDASQTRVWGTALLGVAAVYAGLAVHASATERLRNLSTIQWSCALAALLLAQAALLQGDTVAVAYAATGVALALLARRANERRLLLTGVAVSCVTAAVSFLVLTPPARLFEANDHPGESALVVAACAASLVALAALATLATRVRRPLAWAGAGLGLYLVSLTVLELAEWVSSASVETDFERGHTVVSATWAVLGLGLLVTGLMRRAPAVRTCGIALFGVSLAKLFLYDLSSLSSITRALSFLAVGALLLLGGFFLQRLSVRLDERVV